MKTQLLSIFCIVLIYSCHPRANGEIFMHSSENAYAATKAPKKTSSSKTATWLSKMKTGLLEEWREADSYETKNRILQRYERKMQNHIQHSFHSVLADMPVRVDDIDSTIRSLVYTRFDDSLASYAHSFTVPYLKSNKKTYQFLRQLKEGSSTTVSFRVKSIKVNDPTGPLATFEMEALPMPVK